MAVARTYRTLVAGALVALVLAAPAAAGDEGVAALQVALRAQRAYEGPIDGLRGPLTDAALRAFQREKGLTVDGVVGPQTRTALGPFGKPQLGMRVLELGHIGWDVAALQFALATHGFPSGTFDGDFGARTDAAVRRFQRWAGLAVDGRAGPATLAALAAPPPLSPLAFLSPVDAVLTDPFGPRGIRFHAGIDYPAPSGSPVAAAASGDVAWAGWLDAGYGVVVVVGHGGGVQSWYAHLNGVSVAPGVHVEAGQQIGTVGSTGAATGPHLHFEVRVRGAAVDPFRTG